MNKEKVIQRIKIDFLQEPRKLNACIAIVEYLSSSSIFELKHIHFDELARAAKLSRVKDVLPIVQYLTGKRAPILKSQYYFTENGKTYLLEPSEIAHSVLHKVFFHPETYEPILDYEEKISLYLTLSQDGIAMLKNP